MIGNMLDIPDNINWVSARPSLGILTPEAY